MDMKVDTSMINLKYKIKNPLNNKRVFLVS